MALFVKTQPKSTLILIEIYSVRKIKTGNLCYLNITTLTYLQKCIENASYAQKIVK